MLYFYLNYINFVMMDYYCQKFIDILILIKILNK